MARNDLQEVAALAVAFAFVVQGYSLVLAYQILAAQAESVAIAALAESMAVADSIQDLSD